jgi:hypothetical protein
VSTFRDQIWALSLSAVNATGSLLNSVLTLTGATTSPQNASTSPALAGGTVIYANVSLGALATSYTFKVDVIGFYDA